MDPEPNTDSNKNIETSPMAFTIEFDDQKVDDSRKLKIHERLSAFALKHRRNPSLPDFGVVKNAKSEKLPSPLTSHVPGKKTSPTGVQNGLNDLPKYLKNRRSSLNDVEAKKVACQNVVPMKVEFKVIKNGADVQVKDSENKSDTVSEAGTYTVDKDDSPVNEAEVTRVINKEESEDEEEELEIAKENTNYHHKWINDWVNKVAEQNMLNPVPKEPPPIVTRNSGSGNSSPGTSKIPSPINTLNRHKKTLKPGDEKSLVSKLNGSLHRRSSSLSAKDYHENRTSDSSLDTESYLRTTESVVTAMQNRMKLSLDGRNSDLRRSERKDHGVKEKPHPPSTASDTDTNSENEGKVFKKPMGNPFTSARLNRAFSLRRARAEPETDRSSDSSKKKPNGKELPENKKSINVTRSTPSPNPVKSKPPITSPFARTDCGRFSMRSTVNTPKQQTSPIVSTVKKEIKKTNSNPRSNSSLSSKEVEFQNWKRRKSFDPMKAAAEGRKKQMEKKAAMNQTMTQSVNLGTTIRTRSGNPVLRSASFHSSPHQVLGSDEIESEEFQDMTSGDDQEENLQTSWISNQNSSLTYNSPIRTLGRYSLQTRAPVCSSRCSLSSIVSETHSSPSHRVRAEVLDNLVMTAINDLSYKLKAKSCNLLKKLHYLYDADEDRSDRLRDEIANLENRKNSNSSSPIHQTASKDLSNILKNLKCMENVLKVLDDVLFDENLELYIEN